MKYLFTYLLPVLLFTGNLEAQPETAAEIQPAPLSTERSETIDDLLILHGKITEFDFTQPESRILLDTEFQQWELIAPSAVELRRLGWKSSSLFSGELVEVEVIRPLDLTNKADLKRLTRANGALLLTSLDKPEPQGFEHIPGGVYSLDTDHANLEFAYNHLGFSTLSVEFERLTADVLWHTTTPEMSIIQLDIDASSLNSGVPEFDDVLRDEDFFNTFNHPRIKFRSTQIDLLKWGNLHVDGQLEIKGLSLPIQFDARLNKSGINPITQDITVGLRVTGNIKRSDWGLSAYSPMIEDKIALSFDGEFILKAADIPSVFPRQGSYENSSGFSLENPLESSPDMTNRLSPEAIPDRASDNVLQLTQ